MRGRKKRHRQIRAPQSQAPTLRQLGGSNLKESEKDIELNYVLQGTPLKGLNLRVRNAWYRNDFIAQASHRDDNELRVNVDYTWKLW